MTPYFNPLLMPHRAFSIYDDGRIVSFEPIRTANPHRTFKDVKIIPMGAGWYAQLFIGLNVGQEEIWKPEDIRDRVAGIREQQLIDLGISETEHGASIIPMLGYWSKTVESKRAFLVHEKSVSIEIIQADGENDENFKTNMKDLSIQLVVDFEQDAIYGRFIREGMVVERWKAQ